MRDQHPYQFLFGKKKRQKVLDNFNLYSVYGFFFFFQFWVLSFKFLGVSSMCSKALCQNESEQTGV